MKTPNVVETLKFEEIFSRMKEELVRRNASFTGLVESDPAIKILEVAAWRELLLRQRINDAAQANLLAFAKDNDLNLLAEFYGVLRKDLENDESLRKRVKAKIVGWSTAGSKEHYRYHTLSADTRVKDAQVVSPIPGSVQISILSTENDGVPSEELLEIVRSQVVRDDIRVLTDTLTVIGCGIIPITIHAKVHIYPTASKDVIAAAKEQFIQDLESAKGLGWNVTRSWIIAHLFAEGVQNIELTEPINAVSLTLRGGLQGSSDAESVVINLRGLFKELDFGSWKPAEKAILKCVVAAHYYKLTIDGRELIEIDAENMIRKIDGINQMAPMRTALGI